MKQLFATALMIFLGTACFSQANTKLSNLVSPTAVNQALLPSSSNSKDLGSSSLNWRSLYLKGSWFKGGQRFLSNTGVGNTFLGIQSGKSNTAGQYNTAVGDSALMTNSMGLYNTAFGYKALYLNTNGYNTAVGYAALYSNINGYSNTAIGWQALAANTYGFHNAATGLGALSSNTTGSFNTADGSAALYWNTTGEKNTAIGSSALYNNRTGSRNTAVGDSSLHANNESYNTAVGWYALDQTTTSQYNTAVGYAAGAFRNNGYNNVFIGANTNVNGEGYYNVIAIGQQTLCTNNSQVRLGNAATYSIGGYAPWSNISDGRYKKNIKEDVPGLSFINKLRPVTYNLDASGLEQFLNTDRPKQVQLSGKAKEAMDKAQKEKEAMVQTGFVAQEVEKAAQEVGYDFSGVDKPKNASDLYALRYSDFVVPLVKAVQELSKKDEELTNKTQEIESLKSEVAELRRMVLELKGSTGTITENAAYLEQNVPNPVRGSTTIRYHIPEITISARLDLTNAKGQLVKTMNISKGTGQVNLNTVALSAGTYDYTLYIDGKQVDTRRLVITR